MPTLRRPALFVVTLSLMIVTAPRRATADELPVAVIQRLKAATVFVRTEFPDGMATGSGFVIGRQNQKALIVTNAHVIRGPLFGPPGRVSVTFNSGTSQEQVEECKVLCSDQHSDLAVLETLKSCTAPSIDIRSEVPLRETMEVVVVGFPFGDSLNSGRQTPAATMTTEQISSVRRDAGNQVVSVQINADIHPGNSGGPVVTTAGKLVGVATMKIEGTQIGWAVPADRVRRMLDGSVVGMETTFLRWADNAATLRLHVRTLDPLDQVEKVAVFVGPRTQGEAAARADGGDLQRMSGAAVKSFLLTRTADGFSGDVTVAVAGPLVMIQPAFRRRGSPEIVYLKPAPVPLENGPPARDAVIANQPGGRQPPKNHSEPPADDPALRLRPEHRKVQVASRPLAGILHVNNGLRMTPIWADPESLIPGLDWSADGKYLYVASAQGLVRKIAVDGWMETGRIDLGRSCQYLGMTSEGLAVVTNEIKQVVLLDAETLEVKRQVSVMRWTHKDNPRVNRSPFFNFASGVKTHQVFLSLRGSLLVIDLRRGRVAAEHSAEAMGFERHRQRFGTMKLTTNGKYLFCHDPPTITRLRVRGVNVELDERSAESTIGVKCVAVSPDNQFVAMPDAFTPARSLGGPRGAAKLQLYAATNLRTPQQTLTFNSPHIAAIGIDPAREHVYVTTSELQLIIQSFDGDSVAELTLTGARDRVRQFLVHPQGGRCLMQTERALVAVELADAPTLVAATSNSAGEVAAEESK